jgi:hypothetical protein
MVYYLFNVCYVRFVTIDRIETLVLSFFLRGSNYIRLFFASALYCHTAPTLGQLLFSGQSPHVS